MKVRTSSKRTLAAAAAMMACCLSTPAYAGNANSFFLGDDASLTAGSVAAVTRDSEAIWYNPAGLGGNALTRVNLSGTAFMVRLQKIPGGMNVTLPSGDHAQDVRGNEFLAVPTTLTFMRRATDKVSYGFGVFMPQYSDVTFNNTLESTESFPSIAGPAAYKQGVDSDVLDTQYNLGGAVGVQVHDRFRVGASLFVLYDRLRLNRDQFEDISSADGSGATSLFDVENLRALISTIGLRGTAGLQWEITPAWRLGFVAFSPTIELYSWGETSMIVSGTSTDAQGKVTAQADRVSQKIRQFSGDMVEPFHAQLSLAWVMPTYWIGATADVALPLKKPDLLIDKKLRWNVSVGGKFKVTEKLHMGAGFFTDNSDVRHINDFTDTRVNYYGITYGAEFRTPIARGADEKSPPIVFSTTVALRYALGVGEAGGLLFDPVADGALSNARVHTVDVLFHELSAYIGTALFF